MHGNVEKLFFYDERLAAQMLPEVRKQASVYTSIFALFFSFFLLRKSKQFPPLPLASVEKYGAQNHVYDMPARCPFRHVRERVLDEICAAPHIF